ncbi:MAG: cell division ATP-binding protein FtsE [Anaerotruncus massiliensis (ex Togo et al. 2019)]
MIEFVNVSKVYKATGTRALSNFNVSIDRGEFVFVVGPSGAGKSTFIKLLMREEKPTSGEIYVNGQNLVRLKRRKVPYYRRTLGVVFQDFRLIPTMNVYDNVAFALRVTNVSAKDIRSRVRTYSAWSGFPARPRACPSTCRAANSSASRSRARRQQPPLIIADEPTGNIDPDLSFEIVDLLSEINKCGTTIVMVTHEHNLVSEFDHRVITIDEGTIISDDRNRGYYDE